MRRYTGRMTVTGIEWRDPNPREYPAKRPLRRVPKPEDSTDDDVVAIHGPADEETADGLDEFE
jgi:hypothetical protein